MSDVLISKLEKFVRLGGYEIVRQIKRGRRKGKWTGISEAARRTRLSRPTIYSILNQYPEKPSKVKPKYMTTLEESEGFKRVEKMFKARISRGNWGSIVRTLKKGVKIIGYNKDPVSWTEKDYNALWYSEVFHSEECRGIGKMPAVALRQLMKATNNHNLLSKFKFNNPPEGKKKQWFMHTSDIKQIMPFIKDPETLTLLLLGISTGARHSGLMQITVEKIDFHDNVIQVYEPKVQEYVLKYPPVSVMKILERYVEDMNLKPTDPLFKNGYSWHVAQLKKAGRDAGLKKTITTHIMKHTFVSQAHRHGVSGSTISNQCGTELRCLVKFYRAEDESKLRSEMQGTSYTFKPFYQWITELCIFFRARYAELKAKQ